MPTPKRRIRHAAVVQAFAERLRTTRALRKLTQRELANKAQVTLSYISKLEAGGAAPGIDLLERLALALPVGISELLPSPAALETQEASRREAKALFENVLAKAGKEPLSMLVLFLARVNEAPSLNR